LYPSDIGLLVGLAVFALWYWASGRKRVYTTAGRALEGRLEKAAELLEAEGYSVVGGGAPVPVSTRVDGREHVDHVSGDLVARKGGRTFVAVVKRGKWPSRVTYAHLRDRLLTHQVALEPDAILFVDVGAGRVKVVEFGVGAPRPGTLARALGGAGLATVAGVAAYLVASWRAP